MLHFKLKYFLQNSLNGYTKNLPNYQPISDISHLYVVINWEYILKVPNCNNYSFMHFDQLNLQKIIIFFRVIAMICRSRYWHNENNFTLLNLFVYIHHEKWQKQHNFNFFFQPYQLFLLNCLTNYLRQNWPITVKREKDILVYGQSAIQFHVYHVLWYAKCQILFYIKKLC